MAFSYWALKFGETHRAKTWRSVLFFIFYKITISWLFPLDSFQFIFLLRDSENDLFMFTVIR